MSLEKLGIRTAVIVALVVSIGFVTQAVGQETQVVPAGTNVKYKGYIISRSPDTFVLKDEAGSGYYRVDLVGSTVVRTYKKGVFRGGKDYSVSYLLRGLRLEVAGRGNSDGSIVADDIRFEENDLQAAQSIEVRMAPAEAELAAQAENQKRMEGQMAENAAIAAAQAAKAQSAAEAAQIRADAAAADAARANNRINGLNDFDLIKTVTVPFAVGSATLGPKGKAIIDQAREAAKNEDKSAWMICVVGFADSQGQSAKNKALSERRANAVIGYLVSKYNLPLQRLVQPFGYGEGEPAADNSTAAGRAANRRVEIRVLSNKGIAGKTE